MLSKKNLEELRLTEEQLLKYKEFENKRNVFRYILNKCGVHHTAVDKILSQSDLNKVDLNNLDSLEEAVKEEWSDFIINKNEKETIKGVQNE